VVALVVHMTNVHPTAKPVVLVSVWGTESLVPIVNLQSQLTNTVIRMLGLFAIIERVSVCGGVIRLVLLLLNVPMSALCVLEASVKNQVVTNLAPMHQNAVTIKMDVSIVSIVDVSNRDAPNFVVNNQTVKSQEMNAHYV